MFAAMSVLSVQLRLLAVVASLFVAELVWFVAELGFGVRLQAPAGVAGPQPIDITPLMVGVATLVASASAWLVLFGLERLTRYARRIWLMLGVLVLAGSLLGPLGGSEVAVVDRLVLVLMHILVGSILIVTLYRSSTLRAQEERDSRDARLRTPMHVDTRAVL